MRPDELIIINMSVYKRKQFIIMRRRRATHVTDTRDTRDTRTRRAARTREGMAMTRKQRVNDARRRANTRDPYA
jgi:hypothetical protein